MVARGAPRLALLETLLQGSIQVESARASRAPAAAFLPSQVARNFQEQPGEY